MRFQIKLVYITLTLVFCFIPCSLSTSQTTGLDLVSHAWNASWIRHPEGPQREFGVFHFRKTIALDAVPQHFVIHVSGDNRYELFVNGQRVLAGPARGDLNYWRYETLDLAPYLVAGRNLLAAVVWNFAALAPVAQVSSETGLIIQGDTAAEEIVNTDESWKVYKSRAVSLIPLSEEKIGGYLAIGPGEQVDASQYPWGWETPAFDDSGWVAAMPIAHGDTRSIRIYYNSSWMLTPRTIPLMEDKLERLARVVRTSGVEASPEFLQGTAPVTVPANSRVRLLFDQSYLTTGYPELVTSGGRGSNLTLTYAEALWKGHEKGKPRARKCGVSRIVSSPTAARIAFSGRFGGEPSDTCRLTPRPARKRWCSKICGRASPPIPLKSARALRVMTRNLRKSGKWGGERRGCARMRPTWIALIGNSSNTSATAAFRSSSLYT
jgi:hypothetical protein